MYADGSLTHTHVSTMDRECVSLLPAVCEVLAGSGRSLPDDTSLEKLLDWFTGLTKAGQYRTVWDSMVWFSVILLLLLGLSSLSDLSIPSCLCG